MKILFDMITVCRRTGAGEYVRRVFYALMEQCAPTDIVCLYDSKRGIAYDDLKPERLTARGLTVCDANGEDLLQLTQRLGISHVFIGCAQFWWQYKGLDALQCGVTVIIHDLSHQEKWQNHIDEYGKLRKAALPMFYSVLRLRRSKGADFLVSWVVRLMAANHCVRLVAVSEYTRQSVEYQLGIDRRRISVLYSPLRLPVEATSAECDTLADLINTHQRYYLILGCGIGLKNSRVAIPAFERVVQHHPDVKLLAVGLKTPPPEGVVAVPFLSDNDLELAYAHCHALIYPSLFEGFGYPPVEALRHSKPVLCSNVCSMPEILGDAPVYFSPFYETAVYQAINTLEDMIPEDYARLCHHSRQQYERVEERQRHDLETLVSGFFS